MNILVTGGCGFIGSNFIRQRLTEKKAGGHDAVTRLVNLDALTYAGNPANLADLASDPRYVFAHGSIGDTELVARLLAEHAIDAVVNFAAESHVDRSIDSPEPFVQTNVVGTLRLLNATRLYWAKLPEPKKNAFRFLHVSTDEVYGTLGPKIRRSRKRRPSRQTRLMPLRRPPVIISCARISTPTSSRRSRPTARTITALIIFRKN
jgi:dTDP-glucose 4,6-dehydratase